MPKNNTLKPVVLPMNIKFGQPAKTNFKNNLDAIKVELVSAPSFFDVLNYLPGFVEATWNENANSSDNISMVQKFNIARKSFMGKSLPTALETIGLVFRIEGISLQEVTHIIRYRNGSFSADCSGDKWWSEKDALVPSAIENSDEFYERYKKIVEDAKQLYVDMIDSKAVSIMDSRYILPRCLETFYYMRINLKDAISFIRQRIDKQIQPETDNLIAYQMYLEILKKYPMANGLVDIHAPSAFYIKMARTGKATNLYFPDKDSDMFDWNEKDFIYQCERSAMNGTNPESKNHFSEIMLKYEQEILKQEKRNESSISEFLGNVGVEW